MMQAIKDAQEAHIGQNMAEFVKIAKAESGIEELVNHFEKLEKVDKRKLAIAKTNLEQGILWLMSSLD